MDLVGQAHEKMVASQMNVRVPALGGSFFSFEGRTLLQTNKTLYICFILVGLAASPMRASESSPVSTAASPRITFVVRADRKTGRLVRTPVSSVPAAPISSKPTAGISALVDQASKANHVDPALVHSVIQVESNYNQYAVSPAGAQGLMQLMPQTAKMLGVNNSFDAKENIEAGVRYLKSLQNQFKDDRLALAAYNAGPNAVERYKWVPPYQETQKYVEEVGKRYAAQRTLPKPPVPEPVMTAVTVPSPKPTEERYRKLEQFVDQDGRLHLKTAD